MDATICLNGSPRAREESHFAEATEQLHFAPACSSSGYTDWASPNSAPSAAAKAKEALRKETFEVARLAVQAEQQAARLRASQG